MDRVWRGEYSETVSKVWAVPEAYSRYRYRYGELKASTVSFPPTEVVRNENAPHTLHAAVKVALVSVRGFVTIIMPITQGSPQREEPGMQPDRRRQAALGVLRARSTAK